MTAYFKTGTFQEQKYGQSWHGEEKTYEPIVGNDTVTTAMQKAKMYDIHVGKFPTYIHIGDKKVFAGDKSLQLAMTNCHWADGGVQLLNRSVSWYEPIQNFQYAKILDPLTNSYDLAGVLMCGQYGETVIIQMKMPEYMIGDNENERHKPFLLVAENRKTGLKTFGSVHTRVVCNNTYNAAIAEKGDKSLPNSQDAYALLQFRTRIEQKAIESQNQFVTDMNYLFKKKVGNTEISNLLDTLFPQPKKPQMVKLWEQNKTVLNGDDVSQTIDTRGKRARQLFDNAVERNKRYESELVENFFRFNDDHSYAANTAYGLFQATTQFYNHSTEWQSEQSTHNYNILFGDKSKQMQKAYKVLMES